MKSQNDVAHQMERIVNIFQHAQQIASVEEDITLLIEQLENTDLEFRSIAYEGASTGFALKDLSQGATLRHWRPFMEGPGADHATQVHVGLGWALAQQRLPASSFTKTLHPLLAFRVLDGCGYYDGIFRSRQTINNQNRSVEIQEKYFHSYDLGVGRSLWYRCQGEYAKIPAIVATFSPERHPDLWLGIGIACSYVGGFEEITLKELASSAANHRLQLAKGAALAARTRIQAKSLTQFAEMACRVWCNCSATEAMLLTVKTEPPFTLNQEDAFETWLSQMELALHLW